MRSPAEMSIIQIEITNACPNQCSNCTRLVGHYRKPFFMDFDTFKKAVDSLVDFPGMVGIMGGEPTIHPQFPLFLEYYQQKIQPKERRGLWTSFTPQYYKYFDLIKDVFGFECQNDHKKPSKHQPILVAAKDVIKDEDLMWQLIDKCWIQNLWSASITPKGAFFCEVAAAFDMIFDGPGGWEIDPEWWKKKPEDEDFQHQIKTWCPNCGAAIPLFRRKTSDIIDDVSKSNLERLKSLRSPKVEKKKICYFDESKYDLKNFSNWSPRVDWYIDEDDQRRSFRNTLKIKARNLIRKLRQK